MHNKIENKIQKEMFLTRIIVKKSFAAIVCLFVFALILQVNHVWAHASMVKSDPPRRASLSESPTQVQLWFNEEIEASYASVVVLDSQDKEVSVEKPKPVEDDLKTIVLPLPELSPGRYTVQFRVLSVDGHVVESKYSFRIKDNSQ